MRRPRRADPLTVVLTIAVGVNVTNVLWSPYLWVRVITVVALVATTIMLTQRWDMLGLRSYVGNMPGRVSITVDDDGNGTALVTRQSGEPLVIQIPADVMEQGRDAVTDWVIEQTIDAP